MLLQYLSGWIRLEAVSMLINAKFGVRRRDAQGRCISSCICNSRLGSSNSARLVHLSNRGIGYLKTAERICTQFVQGGRFMPSIHARFGSYHTRHTRPDGISSGGLIAWRSALV